MGLFKNPRVYHENILSLKNPHKLLSEKKPLPPKSHTPPTRPSPSYTLSALHLLLEIEIPPCSSQTKHVSLLLHSPTITLTPPLLLHLPYISTISPRTLCTFYPSPPSPTPVYSFPCKGQDELYFRGILNLNILIFCLMTNRLNTVKLMDLQT